MMPQDNPTQHLDADYMLALQGMSREHLIEHCKTLVEALDLSNNLNLINKKTILLLKKEAAQKARIIALEKHVRSLDEEVDDA
jgi:hypothetical protein